MNLFESVCVNESSIRQSVLKEQSVLQAPVAAGGKGLFCARFSGADAFQSSVLYPSVALRAGQEVESTRLW